MTKNLLSIKSIKVEKLFGYCDYEIPDEADKDISKLLIIYGDNGSGKTTLLKVLFWLLSSRDKSGYKTKLASTKFESISIKFENDFEISASRKNKNLIGSFTYAIKSKDKIIKTVKLEAKSNNTISLDDGTKEDIIFKAILDYIKNLNISVFYLSDDRKILNSSESTEHDIDRRIIRENPERFFVNSHQLLWENDSVEERNLSLEPAIEKLLNWISKKTILGSMTGEKNSQAIFTDLIKDITKTIESGQSKKTKDELNGEIQEIEKRIIPFVDLGLIDEFNGKTIRDSVKKLKTDEQLRYLNNLISPYLESIDAKLNALDKLQNILNFFIYSVNDYFSDKEIKFNLNTGFTISHKSENPIDFEWLSSGEKQLLLLFINTITAADEATIFIIDEPEISLNIKWQRKLIDTLLQFSSDKNIQYIFATHSLELLSSNLNCVSKLKNLSTSNNSGKNHKSDALRRN